MQGEKEVEDKEPAPGSCLIAGALLRHDYRSLQMVMTHGA